MGWTRADLLDPKLSEQDRKDGEQVIKNFMANDTWANRIFGKVGILLTSHPGNRVFLRASVESHRKLGYLICLYYDNYINPEHEAVDYNSIMPGKDVMDNIDVFTMGHWQTWGGVLYPYFWALKWGITVLQDFEYIYCSNGDFIMEKPEGFPKLLELLGDDDIMSCGPVRERSVNTCGFIGKTKAVKAIVQHFQDHFIPFEVYEKYTQEIGNAEGRFGRAIKDLGLKHKIVESADDEQWAPAKGAWYDLVGYRHLHAELNRAYKNKWLPPELKYLDTRYMNTWEVDIFKKFEEMKDIEVLKGWWIKE